MKKPTIYILDDDLQYAELLADFSETAGWNAITEIDPLKFLKNDLSKIKYLVLDLNMPSMDGIEVIRSISNLNINLTLILISGFDARVLHSAQQLAEAHNINVVASLTKPIPITEFVKVLESISTDIPENSNTQKEKLISIEELELGIRNGELVLYYQPQINMNTGNLTGVEALVRWQHPIEGLIFPDRFISLAEKNNLIGLLTERVIFEAVKQNKKWNDKGFDTVISVNVSADNIINLNLPEKLKKLTNEFDVKAENIMIELTESAVMGELTASLDVLNRLRMKGFSLSIDDFGTGYSSLSHLYQAPFTELKIDQSFIMRMLEDTEAMVIVKICITLGQMLGMNIVAEGIETKEVYDTLHGMGCDIAQGYYLSRPIPADDLIKWYNQRIQNTSDIKKPL